jgi:hypothetical protein
MVFTRFAMYLLLFHCTATGGDLAGHTLETDGSRGIPLLAYGLYPTIDDIAKLTTLLQSGGRHDGQQLLSARKIAETLYGSRPGRGVPSGLHSGPGHGR